jgi:tetratricopeptide (TPR) repeat protein
MVAFSQIRLPGQRAPEVELFDRLATQGEGSAEERARDLLGPDFETHRRGIDGLRQGVHGDGAETRPTGEDPQSARQDRWLALTALLQAAARRRRMVLLFEDVHWADETARELLGFLVPATTERGIPVLMTSRPGGWEDHLAGVERLTIGPLDDAAAEALVGGRLEELAPEDRRELIRRSQGNPLFLEELVRDWKDAPADDRRSVPGTVQGLIKSRIDRLEPPLQLLLQMAAVLGTHFPTRLLSRMYALEAQPIGFEPAVQALQERGFIEERSPEERGFRHALMQEVAYGGLLQSVRNVLHESAARIGEEFFADRLDHEAPFFAHHYWHAGLPEVALPHLWRAGRVAFSRYDLPTAEKYLRRAAEVLGPDPDALTDPAEQASFAQTLGDVLIQRGDLAEAEAWFGRLEESGRAEERPAWVVRGMERRARVAWYRGELSESTRLYEAGLRDLPAGEPGLAADLHNGLGVVHHYQALPDLAFDHISRALKLREDAGDRLGMAKCLLNVGSVFLDLREDLNSAERYYQEAYEAAESIGDRQMRYSALNNLGRVATERGEWQEALDTLDRAERILEEIGWSFARYVTLQNRADCEIALGRLGDAIRHLRICRDRGDAVLGPVNRVTTRIFLFDAWYRMFADDLAEESLVEARAVVEETGRPEELHEILLREGRLLVSRERWEEAVEVFARAEAEARQHAAPTQVALAAAHRRRAVVRAGGPDPGHGEEGEIRSRPYATLLRWLEADADATLEPSPRVLEGLGRVLEDAAQMGIVSLERAAAERLAGLHAALGDSAGEALALARAARAMLALAQGLPPERREEFLEHPRNAPLAPHLQRADRAGTAP